MIFSQAQMVFEIFYGSKITSNFFSLLGFFILWPQSISYEFYAQVSYFFVFSDHFLIIGGHSQILSFSPSSNTCH
jgi:hypothetical protein